MDLPGVDVGRIGVVVERVVTGGKVNVVPRSRPSSGSDVRERRVHVLVVGPAVCRKGIRVAAVYIRPIVGTVVILRTCGRSGSRVPDVSLSRSGPRLLPLR